MCERSTYTNTNLIFRFHNIIKYWTYSDMREKSQNFGLTWDLFRFTLNLVFKN